MKRKAKISGGVVKLEIRGKVVTRFAYTNKWERRDIIARLEQEYSPPFAIVIAPYEIQEETIGKKITHPVESFKIKTD